MSSPLYYSSTKDEAYSAEDVREIFGFDPTDYAVSRLPEFGLYLVNRTPNPLNPSFYEAATSYAINGDYADQTWVATDRPLAGVQETGLRQRGQTTAGRIQCIREMSGYGARIFIAVSGLTNANRPAPFQAWMTRQQATITDLGADIATIDGAANVDAVNDVVSAAFGTMTIGYDPANPLDLVASDFVASTFASKNFAMADLELYFPQTTTTVAYSGGFAATAGAFTDIDKTVQIRIAASGLVIDELCVPVTNGGVAQEKEFGYQKYLNIGLLAAF